MPATNTQNARPTFNLPPVTDREFAAMLAGLRLLQEKGSGSNPWLKSVATDCGRFAPLGAGEIDRLCERLNCG